MFFQELFARKLLRKTDIEDALNRLRSLIREEYEMARVQMKVSSEIATELKDGTPPYKPQ